MIYLKRFNESKEHYYVVIEWEHGDADRNSIDKYPFKDEESMIEFLNFIYDIRKFVPNGAWANAGHFEDGHYQRERKWIKSIDAKYGNKFSQFVPNDRHYKSSDYSPAVNNIWVEVNDQPLNIIWNKALQTNLLTLPKIGDTIETTTGNIAYYGPSLWGKNKSMYLDYEDFAHKDETIKKTWLSDTTGVSYEHDHVENYSKINLLVTDCKIENSYQTHERINADYKNGKEIIRDKYTTYHDYTSFSYILLCKFHNKYLTISEDKFVGFDPNFENKFHYPNYCTQDYFLVK